MATLYQKFINFFRPKGIRHIELDPESVRKHNEIRALANENAELKGELAKYRAEEGKKREREQDIEEENEVRFELNERKKEIEKKTYPKYFSLMAFCRKLIYNKKFRENLYFTSFDGSERLAKFGDFGLSSGKIVLLDDEKRILHLGKNPNDVFWSVGALDSDLKAFRIPLCMDKDGVPMENIMVWEASELIPTKNGKFQYSKARKRPLYELLKESMAEKLDLQEQLEEKELTITELQKENDDFKISQRVAEDMAETRGAELSGVEQNVSAISRIFRGTERELSMLRDNNVILEDNLEKLEEQVIKMREEAERQGIKLSDEKALERIKQIRRELVRDEPTKEVRVITEKPQSIQQTP